MTAPVLRSARVMSAGAPSLQKGAQHFPRPRSLFAGSDVPRHKGQNGRIAVVGGCAEYTGAPYYSAMAALRAGADLSHVFCDPGAANVIKSYSPDLIVHPYLAADQVEPWLSRMHALIIGPGLGREAHLLGELRRILTAAKSLDLPVVIDADGLFFFPELSDIIREYGNRRVVLTPNAAEYSRLWNTRKPSDVANEGNVVLVVKGPFDVITDGEREEVCSEPGSRKRCGGLGDILTGVTGAFAHLMKESGLVSAAVSSCQLTRNAVRCADAKFAWSLVASDVLKEIPASLQQLISSAEPSPS